MNLSDINFLELFIKKHGIKVFNIIKDKIKKEEDIFLIFYIAYSDFLGIPKNKTINFIKYILKKDSISNYKINQIRKENVDAIKDIISYIKITSLQ